MKITVKKQINISNRVPFNNNVDYCVGTGRMGLALQKEYMLQLKLVQEEIGFSHIRGHGLFSDDMAIYHEYEEDGITKVEYNFTYLDLVMDNYIEVGLKPFLELGFMPGKLASGDQTIFYWKGNVTPPKTYEGWCNLVTATLSHLMDRYGKDEVVTWPIEVWNEPNLPGFWKDADMAEYFKLFRETFNAVKQLDPRFKVGGPAICGVNDEHWIREFMKFIDENGLKADFISRHHYTTAEHTHIGHYSYAELEDPEFRFNNLHTTREIVDSFKNYEGAPIHITEFNTSYCPNNVIHDTNLNAAYLAHHLSRLGDDNEAYSYWTFGDIFEEFGVPFAPFHGGFGMVANNCIKKPTFYTFAFYKQLKGECIHKDDDLIIVKAEDGTLKGIAWNVCEKEAERKTKEVDITLNLADGDYCILQKIVDEEVCNPLKIWNDLGQPGNLSKEQVKLLRAAAEPLIKTEVIRIKGGGCKENTGEVGQNKGGLKESGLNENGLKENGLNWKLSLNPNAVTYFEIRKINTVHDRGYKCPV